MSNHFGDRIVGAIEAKGTPACVGFDPVLAKMPPAVLDAHDIKVDYQPTTTGEAEACAAAILSFGRSVIDVVADHVAILKINIAFFEPFYAAGIGAYHQLIAHAQSAGLIVIGDVKRADIGHTSGAYAMAHLGGKVGENPFGMALPDSITINPYFGADGVLPFIEAARKTDRGVFILVQTSNSSACEVQGLALSDGTPVRERVAALVHDWATREGMVGQRGYSSVGAVVAPRDVASSARIRTLMPKSIFLVPGFGAQGLTPDDVAACFRSDGTGAIVNASRSVIYAHAQAETTSAGKDDWKKAVDRACRGFVDSLRSVTSP